MAKIDYDDVVRAIQEIASVDDDAFTISDLFPKIRWRRMPIKDRLLLGRVFFDKLPDFVKPVEKNSSNQQKYKKIK